MDRSWKDAANVLCVRFGDVHEVLLATPAIRALKRARKGRRITLLTSSRALPAARRIPEVDEAIAYDAPLMAMSEAAYGTLAMRYALQLKGFDAAAIFTAPGQSPMPMAKLCRAAKIDLRLAHATRDPGHVLSHWREEPEVPDTHEVRRHLELVATVGASTIDERLSLQVRSPACYKARLKLEEAGLDPRKPFLVVQLGACNPGDRWPPERFAAAAKELSGVLHAQVVVTGPAAHRECAEQVRRNAGVQAASLAGSLTLEERAAVIEMAMLVLSDDPDTVHIAAAVGSPVVDLCALGDLRWAPWMVPHRVLFKQADAPRRACVQGVSVQEAVRAACDLWLDIHWRAAA